MRTVQFDNAARAIEKADHILLMTDERSDGDTFGSSLAFRMYVESIGKKATHYATSPILDIHRFLPGMERVTRDRSVFQDDTIDLVIVFDSSREGFIREHLSLMSRDVPFIVFDHHASNALFADINVVDPDAFSTCSLVLEYFKYHSIPVTKEMAKCLMTGMMTDTGMFANRETDSRTFQDAATMLGSGGSIKEVVRNINQQVPVHQLKLWGVVLSRLASSHEGRRAKTWICQSDLKGLGASEEDISELLDYLGSAMDVDLVMFLKERPDGTVKVSMRSSNVNALEIAKLYGGGGHPRACGFTLPGKIVEREGAVWIVEKENRE